MTHLALEESARSGEPIELYKFTASEPNIDTIRLTSYQFDVDYDADTFRHVPMMRTAPEQTGSFEVSPLQLTLPAEEPIVQRFVSFVPGYSTWLNIARFHANDPDLELYNFWHGLVRGVTLNGAKATIQCEPFLSVFNRLGLRRFYQNLCNHVLYDSGCGVDKELFRVTGSASVIDGLTVTIPEAAGFPDQWFRAGWIETIDHDRRMIIDHVGTDLTLISPFSPSVFGLGDVIDLFAGCAHDLGTCKGKFNNVRRYGGFPFIPIQNIFVIGLR